MQDLKIGDFADLYQVSKDTVRYYVKMGLLRPQVVGTQMHFGEKDKLDMGTILRLKNMQLSITEIRSLLYLKRMSNFIEPATLNRCIELLENKAKELRQQRENLDASLELLQQEIRQLEERKKVAHTAASGVPLEAIALLRCPHCGKSFTIEGGEISRSFLMKGQLRCDCGCQMEIRNGILLTGNLYTGNHDTPDLERKLYHETGLQFSICAPRCPEFMLQELNKRDLHGKVIFEGNINGYFFIYNFLDNLPQDCLYIIADKYPEVLADYKSLMETLALDLKVLYIADAGEHLPLARESLDLVVALFGELEYSFYHKQCQLQNLKEQLKPGAELIGAYQSLPWGSQSRKNLMRKYPEGSSRMCSMKALEEEYRQNGYSLKTKLLGTVLETTKHHMYTEHVDGEPLEMYGYVGKKL